MTQHYSRTDIDNMEQRYRANFINCLSGYKSANLIGSINKDGHENVAVFSSVVHLGANPPLLGMVVRPNTVRRDTLENIQEMGCYTINHITPSIADKAHQTSARYDRQDSEFESTGLTSEYLQGFTSPYVKQSPIKMGMTLVEILPIKHNNTLFVIGEIQHIHIDGRCVQEDGFVSLHSADTACITGLDGYATVDKPLRYEYAKKDRLPQELAQ